MDPNGPQALSQRHILSDEKICSSLVPAKPCIEIPTRFSRPLFQFGRNQRSSKTLFGLRYRLESIIATQGQSNYYILPNHFGASMPDSEIPIEPETETETDASSATNERMRPMSLFPLSEAFEEVENVADSRCARASMKMKLAKLNGFGVMW